MKYGSVCSGIEAATVAWHPLGWSPAFFSEIEAFPSAVLAHHYPDVPNRGDMTKFEEWPLEPIDLLVGGTPCQSFSVAGLRAGLADPRGNLMLTYLAIAARYRPRWLVWENVPGVLSSGEGRDFGALLSGLGQLGYGFAYRVLDAQYTRVDRFPFAVPQRRRRVFVVGYLGDWRRAAAVLFDGSSLRGDPAPRREAGQGTAADVVSSLTASGRGVERTGETRGQDPVVAVVTGTLNSAGGHAYPGQTLQDATSGLLVAYGGNNTSGPIDVSTALNAKSTQRQDFESETLIAFDTTQITSKANRSVPKLGDPCHPLAAGAHAPAVAWSIMPQNSGKDYKARAVDVAQPLMAGGPVGGNQGGDYIQQAWAVRRLTPRECERLQGFPDEYTLIPHGRRVSESKLDRDFIKYLLRGNPKHLTREDVGRLAADGPRYKALGNSMAVNCMSWLGERIAFVDAMPAAQSEAA